MSTVTKSALDRRVEIIRATAEQAERGYEVDRDTLETEHHHSTRVRVDNGWAVFNISLGPRGGLRRAEYRTSGWGDGELVEEKTGKNEAWSQLLTIIGHPEPYED